MSKKFKQEEVEKLLAGIREAYDIKIRRLEYRNEGLVAENRSLRASIAELKSREGKVGKAIVDAEVKGEEIKELYRMSAETEWKTLQLFADKWKKLAEQMAGLIPTDDAQKYSRFADDLAALLGREQGKFFSEGSSENVAGAEKREAADAAEEQFDPKAVIEKYIENEEETGFDLDEVLNPKGELDLEKLCRGLGLMDEKE